MAHGARHSVVPRESAVPVMPSRAVLRSVLPGRSVTLRGRLDRSAGEEQKQQSRRACQDKAQGAQGGPPRGPRLSGGCSRLAAHRTVGRSRPGPRVPGRFSLPPLGQSFLRLLQVVKLSCRLWRTANRWSSWGSTVCGLSSGGRDTEHSDAPNHKEGVAVHIANGLATPSPAVRRAHRWAGVREGV